MPDLLQITTDDMVAELVREIKMRKAVYPMMISKKTLKQDVADRRIAVMEAAVRFLVTTASPPTE